jgi:ATP-dependent Clp protease ATP-binding subunit ClpC
VTGMFERFTDRARRVVVQAQEEARDLGHHYLGPEHLLLGLVHEERSLAVLVLGSLGISRDAVRQRTLEAVPRGEQPPSGHIPFTPAAKKLLEQSLRESRALGHDYIGTEHILLALLGEGGGTAAQVLTGLGADADGARAQVVRMLDEFRRQRGGQAG